jgi:hypothetical protein
MLKRYKIISGEFSLVLKEETCEKAAYEAIRLHTESDHHTHLGQITMVESKQEEVKFFFTQDLIDLFYAPSLKASTTLRT